jgi:hypothetical protein
MTFLGIDENGFGPVLGPLVATGVYASKDMDKCWPQWIADSKVVFVRNARGFAVIEGIALALFFHAYHLVPATPVQFLEKIGIVPCKEKVQLCWDRLPHSFMWAGSDMVHNYIDKFREFFSAEGMQIKGVSSEIFCPKQFNEYCRKSFRKDLINFLLFEKLILAGLAKNSELSVQAGKIGGRKSYRDFILVRLADNITVELETDGRSSYRFTRNNTSVSLQFIRDIEQHSLLGVLAGIFGKYVRELMMFSINQSLASAVPVSGYRDKNTTNLLRKLAAEGCIQNDCIVRIK